MHPVDFDRDRPSSSTSANVCVGTSLVPHHGRRHRDEEHGFFAISFGLSELIHGVAQEAAGAPSTPVTPGAAEGSAGAPLTPASTGGGLGRQTMNAVVGGAMALGLNSPVGRRMLGAAAEMVRKNYLGGA